MATPSDSLLEDITTRFILTAPQEQLCSTEALMFLIEQAHWFYEDHVRDQDPSLRSYNLAAFATLLCNSCPELKHYASNMAAIMEQFNSFKKNVPVMGGILLDTSMERVLLVKGWKNTSSWGFPRGKLNTKETDMQCAIREVHEETGVELEGLLREEDHISLVISGKRSKLYIAVGLDPNSTQVVPKNKGEIGGYAWHRIADLPDCKDAADLPYQAEDGTRHKFYMVWPYMKPLKKWIAKRRRQQPAWDMPGAAQPHPNDGWAGSQGHVGSSGSRAPLVATASTATAATGYSSLQLSSIGSSGSLGGGSSTVPATAAAAAAVGSAVKPRWSQFKFDRVAVMRALLSGAP